MTPPVIALNGIRRNLNYFKGDGMSGYESVKRMFLMELEALMMRYDQAGVKAEFDVTEDFVIIATLHSPDGTVTTVPVPWNRPYDQEEDV
jgi:hypothetical protein